MFKFRAKKMFGKSLLFGWLVCIGDHYYIVSDGIFMLNNADLFSYEVEPTTLAVTYTGLTDKNGNQIFASFEVDGKMSKGGDIIQFDDWNLKFTEATVYFQKDCFYADDKDPIGNVSLYYLIENNRGIEIIGKQWSENDKT